MNLLVFLLYTRSQLSITRFTPAIRLPWHIFIISTNRCFIPRFMNKVKLVVLISGILIAGLAFSASAQSARAQKTSSAKAYYGKTPGKPNFSKPSYKDKRKKAVKAKHHTKPAKGTTRADRWSIRRKNSNS
jgi:hypothetical protein